MMRSSLFLRCVAVVLAGLLAVTGIRAQSVAYAYPVKYLPLTIEQKKYRMAYMDVPSPKPNGKAVILLHGKNFNGFYWSAVIGLLNTQGYRVIVPDQVGWGKSDAPNIHYSFHLLASNTKTLLDSLKVPAVTIIGHSMGGMLAIRFCLLFPNTVEKLVLEDPIGLEDYKTFVPYRSLDALYKGELAATYESYKKYQQGYYPQWKPAYEPLVQAQAAALRQPNFPQIAWANAVTTQMIYEQPVIYELERLQVPALLIIGLEDRTIVGKDRLTEEQKKQHGQYPQLGKAAQARIAGSRLVELPGIGHIPHIQDFEQFKNALLPFLAAQ